MFEENYLFRVILKALLYSYTGCKLVKVTNWNTESLKCFEMKPLWVFSDSPRDKNFRVFHTSKTIDGLV